MNGSNSPQAIAVGADGAIFKHGPGMEEAIMRGYDYTQGEYVGRFIQHDTKHDWKSPNHKEVETAQLNASLGATYKSIYNNQHLAYNRQYSAAPPGVTNSENIELLQLIRLHPELQAAPEPYFFLEAGFITREIPHLEYKESFRDVGDGPKYIDRLQQVPASDREYAQISYSLQKLVDKAYIPYEDIWRTIINPAEADITNIRWAFQRARNLDALKAIQKITIKIDGKTGNETIGQIENFTTASPYHSENHTAKELMVLFSTFLKRNAVPITDVFMSVNNYAEYSENTWTRTGPNNLMPERPTRGGIFPLPGLAGITAIVDVEIPDNTIYAINKPNALRLGEGPKLIRRYEDNERDALAVKVIDFNQHLSVDAQIGTKLERNFAFVINVV